MTDISKYKNVSLSKDTYQKLGTLIDVFKKIYPNASRSGMITKLVEEELVRNKKKINGKGK
jgi:hypothetical protein|tara:strand:- start:250 stop:432 length:183 start_codon:yes stop_codon:yes gene_type:complete